MNINYIILGQYAKLINLYINLSVILDLIKPDVLRNI
jgi:hypothetical protein